MKLVRIKYIGMPLLVSLVLCFQLTTLGQGTPAASQRIKLTEAGQPRASILIPASAAASPNLAALELQHCIWKISGAILPIRVVDRSFSGIRIQLDGAEFPEAAWQVTPEKLKLDRYDYMIEFSREGVTLMGWDAAKPFQKVIRRPERALIVEHAGQLHLRWSVGLSGGFRVVDFLAAVAYGVPPHQDHAFP